jgi:TPR repeat protein
MTRHLFHLLLATAAVLGVATAYAMSPEELAMTRNVAERGNASAQLLLAIAYLNGDGGLGRDARLASHWFEQAALQGNGYAEARLGDLYAEGLGVVPNLQVAADWRERAARRGNIDAQLKLGRMYLQGDGVAQDLARAREWLQAAAEGGDSEAAYLLSHLYKHGLGGPRDPTVAGNWLARSAERGYLESIMLLHAIKSFGRHYDRTLSGTALQQLAADGDADAQYQLGLHYEAGSGGERRDATLAAAWFQRAASQGNEQARRALTNLKSARDAASISH